MTLSHVIIIIIIKNEFDYGSAVARYSVSQTTFDAQTDSKTRPFVRCVCQWRTTYEWTKRDIS